MDTEHATWSPKHSPASRVSWQSTGQGLPFRVLCPGHVLSEAPLCASHQSPGEARFCLQGLQAGAQGCARPHPHPMHPCLHWGAFLWSCYGELCVGLESTHHQPGIAPVLSHTLQEHRTLILHTCAPHRCHAHMHTCTPHTPHTQTHTCTPHRCYTCMHIHTTHAHTPANPRHHAHMNAYTTYTYTHLHIQQTRVHTHTLHIHHIHIHICTPHRHHACTRTCTHTTPTGRHAPHRIHTTYTCTIGPALIFTHTPHTPHAPPHAHKTTHTHACAHVHSCRPKHPPQGWPCHSGATLPDYWRTAHTRPS